MNTKKIKTNIFTRFDKASLVSILCFIFLFSCKKEDLKWNLTKAPEVSQITLISNNLDSIEISAYCLSDGYDKATETGFCWSTEENPTLENNQIINTHKGKGLFSSSIEWTTSSTIHVRAYVKNSIATVYSNDLIISWPGSASNKPTIQTVSVTNISFSTCTATANLISNGGLEVYSKGICISTSPTPTLSNAAYVLYNNSTANQFSTIFNDLIDDIDYYVAAFATNLAGTNYGSTISLHTPKHYNVGDIGPSGGYIIYQNPENYSSWNFLEVSPTDISGYYPWAPSVSQTNITNMAVTAGYDNTSDIVFLFGTTQDYAAKMAWNWSFGGNSNWFLPSMQELKLIKELLYDQGIGNLVNNGTYWCSSEDENYSQNAWTIKMTSVQENQIITQTKNLTFRVRAIRRI